MGSAADDEKSSEKGYNIPFPHSAQTFGAACTLTSNSYSLSADYTESDAVFPTKAKWGQNTTVTLYQAVAILQWGLVYPVSAFCPVPYEYGSSIPAIHPYNRPPPRSPQIMIALVITLADGCSVRKAVFCAAAECVHNPKASGEQTTLHEK